MFNKILVAYDGSKTSRKALDKALELKQMFTESALEVVHVFQVSNLVLNDAIISAPAEMQAELYQASVDTLDEAKQLISSQSLTSATLLNGGAPAQVILDYADTHQIDLIIVGSRGLGGLKELFLGSVSSEIVHHAKMPVLVVK